MIDALLQRRSIRFRLTLWYSAVLAAGLLVFAAITWLSMRHSLQASIENELREHGQSTIAFLRSELKDPSVNIREELDEFAQALPLGTVLEVRDASGTVVFTLRPQFAWAAVLGRYDRFTTVIWRGEPYEVLSLRTNLGKGDWLISLASSRASAENTVRSLGLLMLTLSPFVLLAAFIGGTWLSRRALAPVDRMTVAAASIGIDNLSQRLPVPLTGDELQRLAETWNSMLARLEAAVNRLSRFTADASHELRTPLAVIRSTAEIASRRPRPAETYRAALSQIVDETDRLTRMIDDLLLLARCDSQSAQMPLSDLQLGAIVEHVCRQLRPLAEERSIRFTKRLPDSDITVRGNELALRRLLTVLVDNAIKYSRTGGHVNIRLNAGMGDPAVEIEDSGPGIAASEMSRIFERFYRSEHARQTDRSGSGLGLSLAAGIAEHHRARIEVTSTPESGSTFRVVFTRA